MTAPYMGDKHGTFSFLQTEGIFQVPAELTEAEAVIYRTVVTQYDARYFTNPYWVSPEAYLELDLGKPEGVDFEKVFVLVERLFKTKIRCSLYRQKYEGKWLLGVVRSLPIVSTSPDQLAQAA